LPARAPRLAVGGAAGGERGTSRVHNRKNRVSGFILLIFSYLLSAVVIFSQRLSSRAARSLTGGLRSSRDYRPKDQARPASFFRKKQRKKKKARWQFFRFCV
jgi:hypothetical protein